MSGGNELFALLRRISQTTRPRAELRNVARMCSMPLRRVASRVQAASRSGNAALNFKEKMVFSLNTPLLSVSIQSGRLKSSTVDCGTDRAGADTGDCESKHSRRADSYDTTTGDGLKKRSIGGSAYVLTWAWCFLGAILAVVWRSRCELVVEVWL